MKKFYKYKYFKLEKLYKNGYFKTKKPHRYGYPANLVIKVAYQGKHDF